MGQQLLTLPDAAKRLSITDRTLYAIRKRGEITEVNIGSRVLIPECEIERWIDDKIQEAIRNGV